MISLMLLSLSAGVWLVRMCAGLLFCDNFFVQNMQLSPGKCICNSVCYWVYICVLIPLRSFRRATGGFSHHVQTWGKEVIVKSVCIGALLLSAQEGSEISSELRLALPFEWNQDCSKPGAGFSFAAPKVPVNVNTINMFVVGPAQARIESKFTEPGPIGSHSLFY